MITPRCVRRPHVLPPTQRNPKRNPEVLMQFTDLLLKNLKPKDQRYDLREKSGKGFGVRVTTSGCISFIFFYSYAGKKKRMTLGTYPHLSLGEARKKHRAALIELEKGNDPSLMQQQEKAELKTALSISELIDEYIEKWAKPRKRTWQEDLRVLDKDVKPTWGKRKAKDITKRDVITLLDDIVNRGAPIAANRAFAVIRRMFNFAVERDILQSTPCYLIKAPSKEAQRDRVLTCDEIKDFWNKLSDAKMSEEIKLLLKIMLLTAQRKGEIVSARWDDFDFNQRWWTIPAEKAKNGQAHRVYLSDMTISLLEELKTYHSESEWLFPSPTRDTHMTPDCISRAIHRSRDIFGLKLFSAHDLRRTAASHMTRIGIARLVVSKILNHSETTVTAIYDRHSYDDEKRDALTKWSLSLISIIESDQNRNVVQLSNILRGVAI